MQALLFFFSGSIKQGRVIINTFADFRFAKLSVPSEKDLNAAYLMSKTARMHADQRIQCWSNLVSKLEVQSSTLRGNVNLHNFFAMFVFYHAWQTSPKRREYL